MELKHSFVLRCCAFSRFHYCTFKERSDVPHVDAAGLHELSKGDLQEEDRDSTDEDDEQVRDEEDACRRRDTA